jgi:SpoVK/Ycf46/Vps4 family AAA+-type ATPase
MARQIGKMLNAREPKVVNGPEILNKFVGQSEENIRKLFGDAEKEVRPVSSTQADIGTETDSHLFSTSSTRRRETSPAFISSSSTSSTPFANSVVRRTTALVSETRSSTSFSRRCAFSPFCLFILIELTMPLRPLVDGRC